MKKVEKILMTLGLSDKEAAIYLALYRIGQGTAYEIAKECGLKRPTVYVIMEELRKKGLALVIPNPKKQIFIAKDPREFIEEFRARSAQGIEDLLFSLPTARDAGPSTRVFGGEGSLAQGLSYNVAGAKQREVIAFYAGVYPRTQIDSEYANHFEDLGRKGFSLRSLVPSNSHDQILRAKDKDFDFKTRRLSSEVYSPPISIEVIDDTVKLLLHKSREVVVIEDKSTAVFFKQIFEFMWTSGE